MANAKTKEFEVMIELGVTAAASTTSLDMTDYVDIADNEAFEVHEVDIILDPTETVAGMGAPVEAIFQLADSNIQAFVSHADRTSLYVDRQLWDGVTLQYSFQDSFSALTPLIVSKTIFCRHDHDLAGQTLDFTLRIKGRIVKPSAKDYMALVLTQTGNVA
jgi:hypothetical protein